MRKIGWQFFNKKEKNGGKNNGTFGWTCLIVGSRGGNFFLDHFAPSSSASIKVISVFISHLYNNRYMYKLLLKISFNKSNYLSSCFASSILPSFNKSSILVSSHNSVIKAGSIDETNGIFCIVALVEPFK